MTAGWARHHSSGGCGSVFHQFRCRGLGGKLATLTSNLGPRQGAARMARAATYGTRDFGRERPERHCRPAWAPRSPRSPTRHCWRRSAPQGRQSPGRAAEIPYYATQNQFDGTKTKKLPCLNLGEEKRRRHRHSVCSLAPRGRTRWERPYQLERLEGRALRKRLGWGRTVHARACFGDNIVISPSTFAAAASSSSPRVSVCVRVRARVRVCVKGLPELMASLSIHSPENRK